MADAETPPLSLTTRQKVDAMIAEARELPRGEQAGELGELTEMWTIATGLLGRDPLALLVEKFSDAELDLFVDKMIMLLLLVRGDDLPPFDPILVEFGE